MADRARRVERLVNLVIALLATRHVLTVEQLHRVIPDYAAFPSAGDQSFRRMFERDKADLRALGIPLETALGDPTDESSVGYRVARRDYGLPDVHLEPDEAAAVGLAARAWRAPEVAATVRAAVRKLQAVGVDVDVPGDGPLEWVTPAGGAVASAWTAVSERREVRFSHRSARSGQVAQRHVRPWAVLSWRGSWYLVGHDVDRDAPRSFRLSRVVGDLRAVGPAGAVPPAPADVDLVALVSGPAREDGEETAVLAVRPGRAHALRRRAVRSAPGAERGGDDRLELRFASLDRLAEQVVAAGEDVVVLEPPGLREAVLGRLRALAGTGPGSPGGDERVEVPA